MDRLLYNIFNAPERTRRNNNTTMAVANVVVVRGRNIASLVGWSCGGDGKRNKDQEIRDQSVTNVAECVYSP